MVSRKSSWLWLAQTVFHLSVPAFAQDAEPDIFQYIDPLIGTSNGGHVFPGATLPFGMAKAVADVNSGDAQGGYASDNTPSKLSDTRASI